MANAHTQIHREFIVRRLAAFDQPRDVAILFAAMFPGVRCTEHDVIATDPRIAVVSPELLAVFDAERTRIVADPMAAVYRDQNARLIVLSKDVDRHRANNEAAIARTVLRQIAEEVGDIGSGKNKAAPGAAKAAGEPVTEIVRHIVDPKAADE